LAPSFVGSLSDGHGRRPAYIAAFIVYLGANIGLALQNSYPALMVLRCLQSAGSSGTIALGSAVVADLTTRAERGKYIGYASMGISLGPALGPIIGGLLDHFLGWRSIFWFLVILSGVCFIVILLVLPETCRAVVGNGSVIPPPGNRPLWVILAPKLRSRRDERSPDPTTIQKPKRRPNPISSLLILAQKEAGLILLYGGLLFSGYVAVLSTLSTQLSSRFGFNSIQIGLCYLPIGLGSISSRWTVGTLLDWNFRREAHLQGMAIHKNRQQDIENFNIERARLAIALPMIYVGSLSVLAYAWVMQYHTSLAGPIVMLYFMGLTTSGSFNTLNTLVVDVNHQSAATAVAASNLCRCFMGAGTTAFVGPLIDAIGIGWTGTIVAALWGLFSPMLWLIFLRGHSWRQEQAAREQQRENASEDPQARPDLEKGSGEVQS
jgi:multidrug resistance protein